MNQRYDVFGFGAALLAVALIAWTGIDGPLYSLQPRNILFEYQTLIGSLLAVGAAIIALRPAYRQLGELRLQSRQREIERLSARSEQINEDKLAMYGAWSHIELVRDELQHVLHQTALLPEGLSAARDRLNVMVDLMSQRVSVLHQRRGYHWGGASNYAAKNQSIDAALRASSIAFEANRTPRREYVEQIEEQRAIGMPLAGMLDIAATQEMAGIALMIDQLERA